MRAFSFAEILKNRSPSSLRSQYKIMVARFARHKEKHELASLALKKHIRAWFARKYR